MKKTTLIAALYFTAINLTGAYYYNHRYVENDFRAEQSIIVGILWPIYWPARAALWVTK